MSIAINCYELRKPFGVELLRTYEGVFINCIVTKKGSILFKSQLLQFYQSLKIIPILNKNKKLFHVRDLYNEELRSNFDFNCRMNGTVLCSFSSSSAF